MASYLSDELFHFVGNGHSAEHDRNYWVLAAILTDGCVSHPPHTKGWGTTSIHSRFSGSLLTEKLFIPTVTCFCDIPAEHLGIHVSKYGCFGLSFDAGLLVRYGARPVIYVPTRADDRGSAFGTELLRNVESIYRGFHQQFMESSPLPPDPVRALGSIPSSPTTSARDMHNMFVKDFLAFVKPYNSELREDDPAYYYSEREWRKFGNLMFQPNDVRSVVVARGFEDRLALDHPKYATKIRVHNPTT
jgi:hypothetical protein